MLLPFIFLCPLLSPICLGAPPPQALNTHQVFNLCQAREFHSFRKNVCAMRKRIRRSLPTHDSVKYPPTNSSQTEESGHISALETLYRSLRKGENYGRASNELRFGPRWDEENFLDPARVVSLLYPHLRPRTRLQNAWQSSDGETFQSKSPKEASLNILERDPTLSVLQSNSSELSDDQVYYFSNDNSVMTIPELSFVPNLDSEEFYDPRELFAATGFEEDLSDVEAYGFWGKDELFLPERDRKDYTDTTVGMLRKHCCRHGCTLNRHYYHFLSTCTPDV